MLTDSILAKGGRVISDLLKISSTLKTNSLLATIDSQQSFHSVDH